MLSTYNFLYIISYKAFGAGCFFCTRMSTSYFFLYVRYDVTSDITGSNTNCDNIAASVLNVLYVNS